MKIPEIGKKMGGPQTGGPQITITPEMMKNFKSLECDCGSKLFHPGIVFKKISAIVSESGEEELYPLQVLICEECHKVPRSLPGVEILPDEVLAIKKQTINL